MVELRDEELELINGGGSLLQGIKDFAQLAFEYTVSGVISAFVFSPALIFYTIAEELKKGSFKF